MSVSYHDMWRSEDALWSPFFPCTFIWPRYLTQVIRLTCNFSCWTLPPALGHCRVWGRTVVVVTMAALGAQRVTTLVPNFPFCFGHQGEHSIALLPAIWYTASVGPFGWILSGSHCLGLMLHGWQSMELKILHETWDAERGKTSVPWAALSLAYVPTIDGQVTS